MCRAFSCIVKQSSEVIWKFGVDSHTELLEGTGLQDDTTDPKLMTFARVGIVPHNGNYLFPDEWDLHVDQAITPAWFGALHQHKAWEAHAKWLKKLDKILVRKKIVYPFKIAPPKEITKQHINMLREWDSAGAWVGASVWNSIQASVRDLVGNSIWDSVQASVWDLVGASIKDSVEDSIRASVWAYIGSFFILPTWKHTQHPRGKYPFTSCVQFWEMGLVLGFDGTNWRMHGGPKAAVLFEISAEELRKGRKRR